MIVEIGLCGAAGFLFLRGIYHSGILTGWIAKGLMTTQPKAPPPRPTPPPAPFDENAWRAKEAEREAAMFLAVPTAWWLDPNRWGDNPGWRQSMPVAVPTPARPKRPPPMMPRCPVCGLNDAVIVLATHGDEISMWHCGGCIAEFTKKGETRKSLKARTKRYSKYDDLPEAMLKPPAIVEPYQPRPIVYGETKAVGSVYDDLPTSPYPRLPCGCSGFESIEYHQVKNGTTWTRCGRCEKWWEPPSNDGTHRKLAQGEHVHDKDDMQPTAQWYWKHRPTEHGICPNYLCQMPVAKRDGLYYCTSGDCRHSLKGWK